MSTFAGQCESPGEHDGDSSEAQFSTAIQGVACLSNCSVLVTDPSSRSVRIIDVGEHCPRPAGRPQTPSGEQMSGARPATDVSVWLQLYTSPEHFLQGLALQILHRYFCCSLFLLCELFMPADCLRRVPILCCMQLSRWHLAVWSLGGLAAAVSASAGGALLLRKALGRKIRNKRAQVEEASAAGQTHPVLRHLSKVSLQA